MSKCLPNFLIVGAAKSGTSSLHNFLRKHHDVFMPNYIHNVKVKEPRFFVKNSTGQTATIKQGGGSGSTVTVPNGTSTIVFADGTGANAKVKSITTDLLSDTTQETIQMTTVCGLVLKMGDLCYQDNDKFPKGPWCKLNDWIIFSRYAGSRFKIEGGEVRVLNDDEVIAKINDPSDILHHY